VLHYTVRLGKRLLDAGLLVGLHLLHLFAHRNHHMFHLQHLGVVAGDGLLHQFLLILARTGEVLLQLADFDLSLTEGLGLCWSSATF
jgi:hypothetical protein